MKIRLRSRQYDKRFIFLTSARWTSYGLLLLFFYSMQTNSLLSFTPPLVIPLATAVALFEGEIESGVFAIFCGFLNDMASDRLFGFTSFWLLALCVGISLIKSHVLKSNFANYIWQTAITLAFIALVDFLFFHWLFEGNMAWLAFYTFTIPSATVAILVSPIIYIIIRKLRLALSEKEEKTLNQAVDKANTDDEGIRE